MGAGKPTTLDIPNGLARGVRTASRLPDGAATYRRRQARIRSRIMQLRLPVVVIGGGLTADRHRHGIPRLLCRAGRKVPGPLRGPGSRNSPAKKPRVKAGCVGRGKIETQRTNSSSTCARDPCRTCTLAEKEGRAAARHRSVEFLGRRHHCLSPAHDRFAQPIRSIMKKWRKRWKRASVFAEGLNPVAIDVDVKMALSVPSRKALHLKPRRRAGYATRRAASILVAAGTQPNTVLAREDRGALPARRQVLPCGATRKANPVKPEYSISKPSIRPAC